MNLRSVILITIILSFMFSGCYFIGGKRGSGRLAEEKRELNDFSKIEISGAYEVDIIVGEATSLEITGDDNLLEYVETTVRGDRLIIENRKSLRPRRDIQIRITTPSLDEIESSGASDMFVEGIESNSFYLNLSGASSVELEGKTKKVDIELSGAGSITAKRLYAEVVEVSISGASSASVYAEKYLNASVSGVGSIDYYGDPEVTDTDVSGIGSINRR